MDSEAAQSKHKVSRLVLLALGRETPRELRPYALLRDKLSREFGAGRIVLASLQAGDPSLMTVAEAAVAAGTVSDLVILPLFLTLAEPVEQDIPRQVVSIKQRFPRLGVIILPPVGEHPAVSDALYQVARAAAR